MTEIEKSILYDGYLIKNIKGNDFRISPLSVSDVIKGTLKESGLFLPHDKANLGHLQVYNLMDETRRAALNTFMREHLSCDGEVMSIEKISDMGWDVVDIGIFLDAVILASG